MDFKDTIGHINSITKLRKMERELLFEGDIESIYNLRWRIIVSKLRRDEDSYSIQQLAQSLKCHRNTIRNIVNDYDNYIATGKASQIRAGRPNKYLEKKVDKIIEEYEKGKSLRSISKKLNVPKSTVLDILDRKDITK